MEKKRNRWDDAESKQAIKEEKRRRKDKHKAREVLRQQERHSANADPVKHSQPSIGLPDDMILLTSRSAPSLNPARKVDSYKKLNLIEEGSYGIVYRAAEIATGDIVALKKIKFEEKSPGFPVTSLREINSLKELNHPNILSCREVVVGPTHRE